MAFDPRPPADPFELGDTQPRIFQESHRSIGIALLAAALIGIVLVIALVAILAAQSEPATVTRVTLVISGHVTPLTTTARTVGDLLAEQALTLDDADGLSPEADTPIEPGMTIEIERARLVSMTVNGLTTIVRTPLNNPGGILEAAGIEVRPSDRVTINDVAVGVDVLDTWSAVTDTIVIERAARITVVDGSARQIETFSATVGEALFEAGITLFLADSVLPEAASAVEDGMEIVIRRSQPLTLFADGGRVETRTLAQTVGEALAESGIALTGSDYTVPGEDTAILPGMSVRVIRVTEDLITERDELPFETIYQADPGLPLDQRAVIQVGEAGVQERTIRVRYENDVEISRVVETDAQLRAPVDQMIRYGTNVVVRTLDTPDGAIQYWRRMRVYATSYHPAALGGDNITATGATLTRGIVAIDPRIIPYGTLVYVPDYGLGEAADTGAPRANPYWIDLGYDDSNYEHWAGWIDIYILTPVPTNINYLLPVTSEGGPQP
jgi:uncharacterized protein YabE (DUF348 family)